MKLFLSGMALFFLVYNGDALKLLRELLRRSFCIIDKKIGGLMLELFPVYLKYLTFTILILGFLAIKMDSSVEGSLKYTLLDIVVFVALAAVSVWAAGKVIVLPVTIYGYGIIYWAPVFAFLLALLFRVTLTISKVTIKDNLSWATFVIGQSVIWSAIAMAVVYKAKEYINF